MSIDSYANDTWVITGDSLTAGNSDASIRLPRGIRDAVRPMYTRQGDGLGRVSGAKVSGITTYDQGTPNFICSGVAGDPIETCTANFAARVGNWNPKVLVIGLGANNFTDAIPAVLNPKVDALIAKVVDVTQYQNRTLPVGWLWWGCAWRGSETPGGANQAALTAMNAVIGPKVIAAGGIWVDTQALWLAALPAGPLTVDGTHFTQAGCNFVTTQVMAQIRLLAGTR